MVTLLIWLTLIILMILILLQKSVEKNPAKFLDLMKKMEEEREEAENLKKKNK